MEDLKDPHEILLPTRNRILIAFLVNKSREDIPFAFLDGLLLNCGHGSVIETVVGEPLNIRPPDQTHVVNFSIAPNTDRLSSPDRLPSNPRSRALHTSAQDCPRST